MRTTAPDRAALAEQCRRNADACLDLAEEDMRRGFLCAGLAPDAATREARAWRARMAELVKDAERAGGDATAAALLALGVDSAAPRPTPKRPWWRFW